MEVLCRIDISGYVVAIGIDSRRIIVHTSEQEILHTMLENLENPGFATLQRISGTPIGKALETRECVLETDQLITPGSKLEAPGTIHLQNYWHGTFEEDKPEESSPGLYSPVYWLRSGLDAIYGATRIAVNLLLFLIGIRIERR
jgi:hypothetical protein